MQHTVVTDALMEAFVIEGARPLSGSIRAAGNKNAALPIVAACLLTDEPVTLTNVPAITDVETMLELAADLGADVQRVGGGEVRITGAGISKFELDEELCSRIRASILFAGPLLARHGQAVVPPPGGDVIGRRRLDTHIHALTVLGADISAEKVYRMRTGRPEGSASLPRRGLGDGNGERRHGRGAHAGRDGDRQRGERAPRPGPVPVPGHPRRRDRRDRLERPPHPRGRGASRGGEWRICPDHIEVASFIGLAAVTEGEVVIEDVVAEDLIAIWPAFERLGVTWEVEGSSVRVHGNQHLEIRDDIGSQIPKIEDGPWPAFPADLTSIALAVATQAAGTVLIFEKMFENRLFFVDKLVNMGARIILCDPHRAVVNGPARLYGERMESPDIRAGMAMLIASLCAEGTSTIGNIGQIDRGYERIDERLRAVGAHIERTEIS